MFDRRDMLALLIVAAVQAHSIDMTSRALAQEANSATTTQIPGADAQTTKIVEAASAFINSLATEQKTAALFPFTDSVQRAHWSNLPLTLVKRSGVRWGELDDAQHTSLINLLGTILSPRGFKMVREQMMADDVLKSHGGNRPDLIYGSDYYYVSFLGTPSATSPWMLQFGGHHMGINATVVGPNLTLSPSLTGGQPIKFTANGEPIYIVEEEVSLVAELMKSLTDAQRSKAVISSQRIDLVLGPGQDGKVLQPEGLPGSEMAPAQKSHLLELIKAWIGILNANHVVEKIAAVQENLNKTYFAWYGPTSDIGGSYFRVTGPTVLLEFAPQELGGDPPNHLHNMYRDPTNEYCGAWTSLK